MIHTKGLAEALARVHVIPYSNVEEEDSLVLYTVPNADKLRRALSTHCRCAIAGWAIGLCRTVHELDLMLLGYQTGHAVGADIAELS